MIPEACKTLSISSGTHLGSFLERLRAWTLSSEERLRRAESKVLEGTKCKVHVTDVPVKDGSIHTLSISPSSSGRAPVVLVHGYFMGSASWAHSFDALASSGRNVYAIDWPSWGLSSRSSFPAGQGIDACEQFFVDGIESWRKSVGLERVVLLGHSFGGYFAACYTMKYPQHVEKLILASPVGMMGKQPDAGFSEDRLKSLPWWQRFLFYRIKSMWEGGWTPMDFVRVLGPLGLWLTDWYMDRRFRHARELGTMTRATALDNLGVFCQQRTSGGNWILQPLPSTSMPWLAVLRAQSAAWAPCWTLGPGRSTRWHRASWSSCNAKSAKFR
ncbi:unnamed protein product [Durusdinium trenchii]|uniref:AB hydrolase-1 domain-containing protein n=1 Tax=Durusdinium trenchii TaxID=1381693 RepID=A0ABP0P0G6_9DINO